MRSGACGRPALHAANAYHRLLVWDLTRRPRTTRALDTLLNPVLGKSLVAYGRKAG